jgi:serine/threonine protein phosphatase 1
MHVVRRRSACTPLGNTRAFQIVRRHNTERLDLAVKPSRMDDTDLHTFAIGDVHARADLLEPMLNAIADIAQNDKVNYRVVFLGDIIDRGPDSASAMALVVRTLREVSNSVLILGNHDWFPIRILDELIGDQQLQALDHWIMNMGGHQTLQSYGFDPDTFTVDDLRNSFPKDHLSALRNASSFVETRNHILVHAGIAPGIPLDRQRPYDLMWIKEPFLSSRESFGKVVVHGHTVTKSLHCEVFSNRIAIDTGAYQTGRLSCIQLRPDGTIRFLATDGRPPLVHLVNPVF